MKIDLTEHELQLVRDVVTNQGLSVEEGSTLADDIDTMVSILRKIQRVTGQLASGAEKDWLSAVDPMTAEQEAIAAGLESNIVSALKGYK